VKKAIVFSGAEIKDYSIIKKHINNYDFVACADCGITHCIELNLNVNLWVGDFDSTKFNDFAGSPYLKSAEIIRLNPQKDDTDTEHIIDALVDAGYEDITLFGALGTRLDHSLANVYLMEKAFLKGATLTIINENNILHYVNNSTIEINKSDYKYVSVLPLDAVRVSNQGFFYPLNDEVLYRASSRGISNEISGKRGTITVSDGSALVIESID
jgi:thiamine pyrophosphokinase